MQKLHLQALSSAEEAIRQTKSKVTAAFERLAALGVDIESALDEADRPKENEFVRTQTQSKSVTGTRAAKVAPARAASTRASTSRTTKTRTTKTRTATTRKSVGNKTKRK